MMIRKLNECTFAVNLEASSCDIVDIPFVATETKVYYIRFKINGINRIFPLFGKVGNNLAILITDFPKNREVIIEVMEDDEVVTDTGLPRVFGNNRNYSADDDIFAYITNNTNLDHP